MAKSLGQIHIVNQNFTISAAADKYNIDLPGELTNQLQTMVRAGTYHKVVGIDMTLKNTPGLTGGGQVSGHLRYFAPTKGRCDAFRGAFRSMANVMKAQGLHMRDNPMYDFRAPINNDATVGPAFENQATLDGSTGLALNHTTSTASIFGVHNENQQPRYTGTAGNLYNGGFKTLLQDPAVGTDFVLNDAVPYTGDRNFASQDYEEIPFVLSWTPTSTDLAIEWMWRPDPALFLAVLCGQFQVVIDEIDKDGTVPSLDISIAVSVAGWKSIMGNPEKKRRTRRKSSLSPELQRLNAALKKAKK